MSYCIDYIVSFLPAVGFVTTLLAPVFHYSPSNLKRRVASELVFEDLRQAGRRQ